MPLNEADTNAKRIDPALHYRGWTQNLIKLEETTGAIEIITGITRQRAASGADCALRLKGADGKQLITVAVLQAKVFSETKRRMFSA